MLRRSRLNPVQLVPPYVGPVNELVQFDASLNTAQSFLFDQEAVLPWPFGLSQPLDATEAIASLVSAHRNVRPGRAMTP